MPKMIKKSVDVSAELKARLRAIAQREGKSMSAVARDALEWSLPKLESGDVPSTLPPKQRPREHR